MVDQKLLRESFPFETPRKGQLEIIEKVLTSFLSGKKYILLEAPTGIGKSVIAMTISNYFNSFDEDSFLLTTEKILQNQYSSEFGDNENVAMLLGRSNYKCNRDPENLVSYDDGYCHVLKNYDDVKNLPCFMTCPYKQARRIAKETPNLISNYHYLLFDQDYLPSFVKLEKRDTAIFDESHNLMKILLDYTVVSLSKAEIVKWKASLGKIEEILGENLPSISIVDNLLKEMQNTDDVDICLNMFSKVEQWSSNLIEKLEMLVDRDLRKVEKDHDEFLISDQQYESYIKKLKYASNFKSNLGKKMHKVKNMIKNSSKSKWVVDHGDMSVEMKPVYASFLFNDTFNQVSNKFLFMSATPPPKDIFCETFNLDEKDVEYFQLPSPFPIENRRVYAMNYCSMSYRVLDSNLPIIVDIIDDILDTKVAERVMVHTGTYKIANYVYNNSRHRKRMLLTQSDTRDEMVETYKESKNKVLLSPSLMEGLSLDYDLCRVQIVIKVPYPSLADKRMKIIADENPNMYKYQAVQKLIQACGRGVRHEDDFCETFVFDSNFNSLLQYNRNLFPEWFLDAVVEG